MWVWKGMRGSGGADKVLEEHGKKEKKGKMEGFECQDKESSRKSGKSNKHNTIAYNNRPGCSGIQEET